MGKVLVEGVFNVGSKGDIFERAYGAVDEGLPWNAVPILPSPSTSSGDDRIGIAISRLL